MASNLLAHDAMNESHSLVLLSFLKDVTVFKIAVSTGSKSLNFLLFLRVAFLVLLMRTGGGMGFDDTAADAALVFVLVVSFITIDSAEFPEND